MKPLLLSLFSVTALAQAPSFPAVDDDFDDETIDVPQVSSVEAFEPALAPYGRWVSIEGQRAFQPSPAIVGPDFVPYASQGQWVSTQAGWSFSTSLPFGWATYHYGRWWLDQTHGWLWLPDTEWGPAWVDWRDGGGYLGWAPLPPPRFVSSYRPSWFFVRSGVFASPNVIRYGVPRVQLDSIFGLTISVPSRRYRGNTWYSGPAYRDVARFGEPPQQRSMSAFGPPPEVRVSIRPRVFVRDVPPPPAAHWSRPWPVGSAGWPNRGIAPAVRQQNVHQAVPVGPPPPRSGVHQAQPVGPPPARGGGRQRR